MFENIGWIVEAKIKQGQRDTFEAAHIHIDNWDNFAARWVAAAEPTCMVHLGDLPDDLRKRHAALAPLWLKPFGGFAR